MMQDIALTVLILGFLAILFSGIEFKFMDIYSSWSDAASASRIYLAFLFSTCLVWPKFLCILRRLIVPTFPEISYPESLVGNVKSSNPYTGVGPSQWLHFMYRCSVKNIVMYYGSTLLIAFFFLFISYFKLTHAKFSGYKYQYLSSIIFSILHDLVYLLIGNIAYPSILLGPFFSFTSLRALFRGYALLYYDSEYQVDILFQLFELLLVSTFYLEPITLQIIIATVFSAGYLILAQTRKPVQILPILVPFLLKSVSLQVIKQGLQPWIPYSKLFGPKEGNSAAIKPQPEHQKKGTQLPFSRLEKWKIEEKKISK